MRVSIVLWTVAVLLSGLRSDGTPPPEDEWDHCSDNDFAKMLPLHREPLPAWFSCPPGSIENWMLWMDERENRSSHDRRNHDRRHDLDDRDDMQSMRGSWNGCPEASPPPFCRPSAEPVPETPAPGLACVGLIWLYWRMLRRRR